MAPSVDLQRPIPATFNQNPSNQGPTKAAPTKKYPEHKLKACRTLSNFDRHCDFMSTFSVGVSSQVGGGFNLYDPSAKKNEFRCYTQYNGFIPGNLLSLNLSRSPTWSIPEGKNRPHFANRFGWNLALGFGHFFAAENPSGTLLNTFTPQKEEDAKYFNQNLFGVPLLYLEFLASERLSISGGKLPTPFGLAAQEPFNIPTAAYAFAGPFGHMGFSAYYTVKQGELEVDGNKESVDTFYLQAMAVNGADNSFPGLGGPFSPTGVLSFGGRPFHRHLPGTLEASATASVGQSVKTVSLEDQPGPDELEISGLRFYGDFTLKIFPHFAPRLALVMNANIGNETLTGDLPTRKIIEKNFWAAWTLIGQMEFPRAHLTLAAGVDMFFDDQAGNIYGAGSTTVSERVGFNLNLLGFFRKANQTGFSMPVSTTFRLDQALKGKKIYGNPATQATRSKNGSALFTVGLGYQF